MPNLLTPFQFDNDIAHGAFIEIDTGVADMLDRRAYGADVRALVGQAMAAMPLLATHARFEGRINLQFQGGASRGASTARSDAPRPATDGRAGLSEPAESLDRDVLDQAGQRGGIQLLVAQATQSANGPIQIRAMAKAAEGLQGAYEQLLGGGVLALMLEPASDEQPARQAMVPIDGDSLSESLEGYFAQSEQLPTLIRLAAGQDRLCGFLLQRLPLEHTKADEDYWEHVAILAATLQPDELLATPPETLLRRLFAEEHYHLQPSREISVGCRCSREGISLLLISLGREEVEHIVADQGRVAVTCEFCGKEYVYSKSDAVTLFAAEGSEQSVLKH